MNKSMSEISDESALSWLLADRDRLVAEVERLRPLARVGELIGRHLFSRTPTPNGEGYSAYDSPLDALEAFAAANLALPKEERSDNDDRQDKQTEG